MVKKPAVRLISGFILFFFIFTLGLGFGPNQAMAASTNPYNDVSSSHWAYKHIAKMNLRGVVSGYTDGSFKPDNAVTQLEAVLMAVKNMEADSELAAINVNQSLPFEVPAWALTNCKKELLFAVQKGLIPATENSFNPSAYASRAWMTRLMVRMIGKDSEASLNSSQAPGFTDSTAIPTWAVGYINVATKYDLISGFPDNSFKPNQIVTRAQSVSLLSRSEKYLQLNSVLEGKISSISGSNLILSSGGRLTSLTMDYDVLVFDADDELGSWLDLKNNDSVSVIVTGSQARFIDVTEQSAFNEVITGTVLKVLPEARTLAVQDAEGTIHTKTLGSLVTFTDSRGNVTDLSRIQEGSQIDLNLDSWGEVVSVVVNTAGGYLGDNGLIYSIDQDLQLIILKKSEDNFATYKYNDLVEVFIPGQRFALVDDLRPGDEVKVKTEGSILTAIELVRAQQELSFSGKVILNYPEKSLLVIEDEEGIKQTYEVPNNAEISIGGISSPLLSDIRTDDQVNVTVKSGKIASIKVTNRDSEKTLQGTVVVADEDNMTLVLKNSDGDLKSYEISKLAQYVINDKKTTNLSSVKKDMQVEIELLGDKVIYLENKHTIAGIVVGINPDRNLISIKNNNSEAETYLTIDKVDVYIENISRAKLDDVNKNDYVEVKIADEAVTDIYVEKSYICEVTRVYDSYIKVKDEDDDSKYIYDEDKPEIIIAGISSPRLKDFDKGDTIRATYLGYTIKKVELVPALAGQITGINSTSRIVTVHGYDGKQQDYRFDSASQVIEDGREYYSLSALSVGDRVKVKAGADKEVRFYILEKVRTRFVDTEDKNTKLYVSKYAQQYSYNLYNIASPCYIHKGSQVLSFRDLAENDWVDIYVLDDVVFEIEKV